MSYDLFGTREMTEAVQTFLPVGSFFRTTFFGGTPELHNHKLIDLDIYKGKRIVAPYTKSSAKSTPLARTEFRTGAFEIPYMKPSRSLEAAMTLLRQPGENIYSNRSPAERAAEQLIKDLRELDESIQRAEEKQAAEAIVYGQVTIKGDEVDALIDLDRDSDLEFSVASADQWDEDTADIHKQFREYARLVFAKSGYTPNIAIMSATALDAFFANPAVQFLLDNRRMNVGNLSSSPTTTAMPGARSYGNFAGFDIWEYHELWLDPSDDTEKNLVPDNYIVLASQGMRCKKHYGPIMDLGALIPLTRFVKKIVKDDPSVIEAVMHSAPAFINHDPDATALIKVLNV